LRFPRYQKPALPNLTLPERIALFIGCGFGSGFIKPGPGTWGSVVGFVYFAGLLQLPGAAAVGITLLVLGLSVWSGGICERLLQKKDPGEVVIDEIASIPIVLWPLFYAPHASLWVWLAGFVAFRVLDIAKPFPIKQLQCIHGGLGILIDDVVAALFASGVIWLILR
jgi:phosphatidylglycerophosphatase A